MIRRKLFAYTIMLTAGISAGYFIMEKSRLLSGTAIILTTAAVLCLYSMYLPALNQLSSRHNKLSQSKLIHSILDHPGSENPQLSRTGYIHPDALPPIVIKLIAMMAIGFLIFTFRYIHYETILDSGTALPVHHETSDLLNRQHEDDCRSDNGHREGSETSRITDTESQSDQEDEGTGKITGEVLSAETTDTGMKIVLAPRGGRCKVRVSIYDAPYITPAEVIGQEITAFGQYREPPGADNPGCFDYRTYLRSRGIGFLFSARNIEVNSGNMTLRGKMRRQMFLIREGFLDTFEDESVRAFIKGVVFGDKTQIDEEVRDDFNRNGTGHILAVSGLHTGFLYSLLRLLAGKKKTIGLSVLIILILLMYGEMTMWSPSTMRAVTVLSISIGAVYMKRPFDLLSSVSAAAFLMLIIEPYQLMSSGFQMSFAAMLAIAFLVKPLAAFIGEPMAVMLAVQIGVAPLTAFIFHRLNLLSFLINIPVIFIASILVPLCMCDLFLSAAYLIPGSAAAASSLATGNAAAAATDIAAENATAGAAAFDPVTSVIEGLSEIIVGINSAAANLDFSVQVTGMNAGLLILIYLCILLISSEWCRIRILRKELFHILLGFFCIAAVSVCFTAATYNPFADDEIVFVSIGQGDCTHIRVSAGGTSPAADEGGQGTGKSSTGILGKTKNVLIDGGGSMERDIGEDTLMPYLLSNRAENVDLALATHLHTDHVLGLLQLDKVYPVGAIGIPDDYKRSIEISRKTTRANSATDKNEDNESQSLHSSKGFFQRADRNDTFHDSKSFYQQTNTIDSLINECDDLIFISPGSRIDTSDQVYIEPIWPLKGHSAGVEVDDPNENNMVFIVNYGGVKIMVTGDLLEEDENEILRHYPPQKLHCDVLKVAHHGSKSSSSEAFLDAVSPSIAVIQVGKNNFYGHPHQQTLDRLEERGIQVYRTDQNGAVGIDIISKGLEVDLVRR